MEYDPLCSHLSLKEPIRGDLTLTAEELELAAAIRRARTQESGKTRQQEHRAKKREEDLDGYRVQANEQKSTWRYKNPDKVHKTQAKTRNKAKDEQRFFCDDCQQAFATQYALNSHKNSQTHLDSVAGLKKTTITAKSSAQKADRKQALEDKTYYCSICDKPFGAKHGLDRHVLTSTHAKKLAMSTGNAATTS